MRGRKPLPTALRILRNNPGKRAINRNEPVPDALPTACPDELVDPLAQQEWRRTIVPAVERGQITAADIVMAIAHCELWATWRSQLSDAARHTHVVAVGPHKYPAPNPARGMANRTFVLLAKVDAELGLTLTSRGRIVAGPDPFHRRSVCRLRTARVGRSDA
jgi:P27 family predicted phage terminase small subunit